MKKSKFSEEKIVAILKEDFELVALDVAKRLPAAEEIAKSHFKS